MLEARKWLIENRDRMIETVIEETRQDASRTRQLAEVFFCADSLGFWAKKAPKYLARREGQAHHTPFLLGKKLIDALPPAAA